ncbi:Bax inhibitor-1/YccA family protein [Rickettsiales bacterium]|nr:Bax inhibitor-1/YccA family protein [Rickettsiales bacterium]
MSNTTKKFGFSSVSSANSFNEGLRSYMLGIYNYMTTALLISALSAYLFAKTGLAIKLFTSPVGIIVSLAPIGIALYLSSKFHTMTVRNVRNAFFLYATVMGISMSTIFVMFRFSEIATAFFATGSMFAGMSIYGYVTKKDLSSLGAIMGMAILGIVIASLVNMFTHSSTMALIVSFISIIVFSVMVAYDTQRLKQLYYALGNDSESAAKVAIFGAMQLYIDFVIIFMNLLQILGLSRKD